MTFENLIYSEIRALNSERKHRAKETDNELRKYLKKLVGEFKEGNDQ